ncbi:MAG: hypothetical protein ABIX37_10805 [Gammaproteobacteria bacterium]
MSGYHSRIFVDGRLVGDPLPSSSPDSPWYRKPVAEQAEPPKPASHVSLADKHGVYRLKVGASVVIPYNGLMPDVLQCRISVVLRRRKLAWPERYNTKTVTGGIRVTRTI